MGDLKRRVAALREVVTTRHSGRVLKEDHSAVGCEETKEGTVLGSISVRRSETVNMGDYNSTQYAVEITLPCVPEKFDEAMDLGDKIVDARMGVWLDAVLPKD